MGETAKIIIVFLILAVLQAAALGAVAISAAKPDLLLAAVIFFSLSRGSASGCALGFFAGFLKDITGAGALGANMAGMAFLGLLAGLWCGKIYRDSVFAQMLTTFLSGLALFLFYCLFMQLAGRPIFFNKFILPAFLSSLYSAGLSPFVFRVLRKFFYYGE